jgi:hypothetical protein
VTLWDVLRDEYLAIPTTEMLCKIEEFYWRKLNFSNYLGALDGVQVEIKCPAKSGSLYYNYKQWSCQANNQHCSLPGALHSLALGVPMPGTMWPA